MDEQKQYSEPVYEDEGFEIDWAGIFAKLLKRWKFIFLVSFIFGCLGIAAALLAKRYYQVTVTLAPELQKRGTSINNITSMLGLGNISLDNSSDAMSITLFPEICNSTPFITSLFDVKVDPYYSPKAKLAGAPAPQPVTVFDHMMGYDKPRKKVSEKKLAKQEEYRKVFNDAVVDVSALTPNQQKVAKALKESIGADVDKKTGVTTVSVVMDDRQMVAQLADTVTARLQEYVTAYRTKKAIDDYNYYERLREEAHANLVKAQQAYAARVDYDRSVILQSVNSEKERLQQEASLANQLYSQMAQQAEMAKAKIQEERPMYAVIQPATMPYKATKSRAKTVIIWGFVGVLLSCLWVAFGEDFVKKARKGVKEKMEEE